MPKKILIVEDDISLQRVWTRRMKDLFKEKGEVVIIFNTFTIENAEKRFLDNPDVDLIAMDACVPGNQPNTLNLVKKIRETFSGPMVAISGCDNYQLALVGAGCDYMAKKNQVPQKIIEILF